jgi:hypothetical protein
MFKVTTMRGKTAGTSGEVMRRYKEFLKIRAHLITTFPGLTVPELPSRLKKGKKLADKDLTARRIGADQLLKWVVEQQIDDAELQSFLLYSCVTDFDDRASDSSESMEGAPVAVISEVSPAAPEPEVMLPTKPTLVQDPSCPKLQVTVVGTSEGSSVLRRYAVYELSVTFGSSSQVIGKRFSEFKALDYVLRPKYSLGEFPEYSYLESSTDQDVVESRKGKLQQYLNSVVESEAEGDPELLKFLNLLA